MNLSQLKPPPGQKHKKHRLGPGHGHRPRKVFRPRRQGRQVDLGLFAHARI